MNAWTYQPGAAATPPPMCTHPTCTEPGTHDRDGFLVCFDHWLLQTQWKQPRIIELHGGLWAES